MVNNNDIDNVRISLNRKYAYLGLSDNEILSIIKNEYLKYKTEYETGYYSVKKLNRDVVKKLRELSFQLIEKSNNIDVVI